MGCMMGGYDWWKFVWLIVGCVGGVLWFLVVCLGCLCWLIFVVGCGVLTLRVCFVVLGFVVCFDDLMLRFGGFSDLRVLLVV